MIEPTYVPVEEGRLKRLEDSAWFLECLQAAGVDNWNGYDLAQDLYNGEEE